MKRRIPLISIFVLAVFAQAASAAVILPPGSAWEYTFSDPTVDSSWNTTTGVGGSWSLGNAPFSNTGSGDFALGTYWAEDGDIADDLWVRTALDLTGYDLGSLQWSLGVDNGYKLYVNGSLVSGANAEGFTSRWEYSGSLSAASLFSGINVVAVALEDHGGLTAFDMQITGELAPVAVSEPATLSLLGMALLCLGFYSIRRRNF